MNYIHHALIGVGTASLGVVTAEALGMPAPPLVTLGIGALLISTGSIATDLDHPKSFISNSIPSHVIRIALAVLVIPLLAGLTAMLTAPDPRGTWTQLAGLVFRVNFLRWALIALLVAFGLILLSWVLYRSLHHRGPLHSIIFSVGITVILCLVFWWFWIPWAWGLAFGWGWLWHILADGLTEGGVPFFWPFIDERKHTLAELGRVVGRPLLSIMAAGSIILLIYFQISGYFS